MTRQLAVSLVACLAATCMVARGALATEPSLEAKVRAACVLNFIQFTDWPETAFAKSDDPIVIGVIDPDPLEGALATASEGKSIRGRKLVLQHVTAANLGRCHVLIVGSANSGQMDEILKAAGKRSILTIGDSDDFTELGGMIRFYVEDRKERFEINQAAAGRAQLQISSKLLKLAKVVNK